MAEPLPEISELENCPKCSSKLPPRFATGRVVCGKCGWTNQPKNVAIPSVEQNSEEVISFSTVTLESIPHKFVNAKRPYIYFIGILVFFLLGLGYWKFGPISSTPASEDLLQTIEDTRSRIQVGVNYIDYQRLAQDIQIKLDRFERDSNAERLAYGANLWNVATTLIYAAKREEKLSYGDKFEWNPQPSWSNAEEDYNKMQECRKRNRGCFKLSQKLDLMTKNFEEKKPWIEEFIKNNSK
jgi:ribosomal protein S27AE